MKDFVPSVIRTFVPIVVGLFLAWLASKGITVDATAAANLTAGLSAVFMGVYYFGVRLLEHFVSKKFGWLLGQAVAPEYNKQRK